MEGQELRNHLNAVMANYKTPDLDAFFSGLNSRCKEIGGENARFVYNLAVAGLLRNLEADFQAALAKQKDVF